MSIHPSLKIADKDKKQRSVLKRTERLKSMLDRHEWKPGDDVCGLPKIKTLRIRIKKEKAEKTEAAPAAGATATGTATKEQAAAAKTPAKK